MKNTLLVFLFAITIGSAAAQKLEVVEGDLSQLSGLDKIHFEFVYDDLVIGESKPEADFVAEKSKAWDEREQGKGAEWKEHWISSRSQLYEPAFIKAFQNGPGSVRITMQNTSSCSRHIAWSPGGTVVRSV